MNIPNKLTIFRVLLIPVFLWFMYADFARGMYLCLAVFVLASVTDCLDGYIARKRGQVTTFGKFADPLADKLLVTAALITFVDLGYISGIIAVIVISREFIVTGLRLVAISDNKVIAAGFWGKLKTVLQISAIIAILLVNGAATFNVFVIERGIFLVAAIVDSVIILMTAVTVVSGIDYIWKNRKLIRAGGN